MSLSIPFRTALKDLPVYQPGRPIEEVARELGLPPKSIIKMASNENPLGPSPKALAAMKKAVNNLHLYPDGNSFYLKAKLAESLNISPANLILGNGSNEIIEFVAHALLEPGSEIIVSQYCFAIYPIIAKMFGASVTTVPARDYGHDIPAMMAAITPKTRVIFVANPNNPTGTLAPRAEIMRLVNEVPKKVLVVLDEAYIEFMEEPIDLLPSIREGQNNLLLMRTFSKIFGLAGLRIGYGIANPEVVTILEKVRQPFNINAIAQAGALAGLDDFDHLHNTRMTNIAGLRFFRKAFEAMDLKFVESQANFVLVEVGDGQEVFNDMQKQGVIVRPMAGYQLPRHIRISIGTPAENKRCLAALKKALKNRKPKKMVVSPNPWN